MAANRKIAVEALSDDALIALLIAARKEAQRRGIEAEAEVWAAALADEEKTRIAREAAAREAERLRAEEGRRIAREAAEKVRREAEAKAKAEAEAKAQDKAARLRAVAVRARELFGSDQADFRIELWERSGDKRVYVGHGYEGNWVEYYHTGNARTAPGSLVVKVSALVADLAAHLEISKDEARSLIRDFCAALWEQWGAGKIEVNASNAPRDEACRATSWVAWDSDPKRPYYFRAGSATTSGDGVPYTSDFSGADRFATEAEAREAVAGKPEKWAVKQVVAWRAYPPKPEGA